MQPGKYKTINGTLKNIENVGLVLDAKYKKFSIFN